MNDVGAVSGPHDPFTFRSSATRAAARRQGRRCPLQAPLLYVISRWCEMMKWSVGVDFSREPGSRNGDVSLNESSDRIRLARVGFAPALYIARTNVCAFAKP